MRPERARVPEFVERAEGDEHRQDEQAEKKHLALGGPALKLSRRERVEDRQQNDTNGCGWIHLN